jgi:hypothetical protein
MPSLNVGHAVALKCLGDIPSERLFLDGNTGTGGLGLAPNFERPFTGARWLVASGIDSSQVLLKCLGEFQGVHFLDGNTFNHTVSLVNNTELTGTRWQALANGPTTTALKCLGDFEGEGFRFLDGRTQDSTVGLANDLGFSGTRWEVIDLGPAPISTALEFSIDPVVFEDGVPVGGSSRLTLRQDGTFTFSGHFHDSGALEFNVGLAWGVKDAANRLYTFSDSGEVAGTLTPGSRDHDWNVDSFRSEIAENWSALAAGSRSIVKASASVDLFNVTSAVVGAAGLVLGIIAVV